MSTRGEHRTSTGDDGIDVERIGVHNEAQTIRRDRIRWGPIWAGVVTAIATYLILQLALIALGIVELGEGAGDDAIISGIAALIAFFLGAATTGATAMWQGADDGIIHGMVMFFAALVALLLLSLVGSGVALGSLNTSDAFSAFSAEDVDTEQANDEAEAAAAKALLALGLGLGASAVGGAVGAKLWPKDDAFVDVPVRRDTRT